MHKKNFLFKSLLLEIQAIYLQKDQHRLMPTKALVPWVSEGFDPHKHGIGSGLNEHQNPNRTGTNSTLLLQTGVKTKYHI